MLFWRSYKLAALWERAVALFNRHAEISILPV
jgi:hypothetical protein